MLVYDMHSHLYEYGVRGVEEVLSRDKSLVVVAVSDDPESVMATFELAGVFDRVVPCAGFHPWNLAEGGLEAARESLRLAYRLDAPCIGEVGLDRRFVDEYTWGLQLSIFREFLGLAREMGVMLNIHSPDAWNVVAGMLMQEGPVKAMLHWYTGPLPLVWSLGEAGVKVSINAALRVQKKSMRVAVEAPLDHVVFESDGPYEYRGLKLSPVMVRESIRMVADARGLSFEEVAEAARLNSERLLHP